MATKLWVGTDSGNEGDWSVAANWSPSGVPVSTDDVVIYNSAQDITAGLNQSAVALNSLTIDASYTGIIGTTANDFLQVGTSILQIGERRGNVGTFTGSKRLNIDLGSTTACTGIIYSSSTTAQDQNRAPIRLLMANASTTIRVLSGSVSISDDLNDTSTVDTVTNEGGVVTVGRGVTIENVITTGGTTNVQCSTTVSINAKGGVVNLYDGLTASTHLLIDTYEPAVCNVYSSGTITTANVNSGTLDLTKTNKSKTVTNLTLGANGNLIVDTATATFTNKIALPSNKQLIISARSK